MPILRKRRWIHWQTLNHQRRGFLLHKRRLQSTEWENLKWKLRSEDSKRPWLLAIKSVQMQHSNMLKRKSCSLHQKVQFIRMPHQEKYLDLQLEWTKQNSNRMNLSHIQRVPIFIGAFLLLFFWNWLRKRRKYNIMKYWKENNFWKEDLAKKKTWNRCFT